jgi:hypothetical protein
MEANPPRTLPQPFLEWNFNTSLLVRNALPLLIQRPEKPDINIRKYARTTRDTYTDVRRVSKEIWSGQRSLFLPELGAGEEDETLDIDFILHLGMEVRDEFFGFETKARREGYEQPGDDGVCVDSAGLEKEGLPGELSPRLDVEVAFEHVESLFPVSGAFLFTRVLILTVLHRMPNCVSQTTLVCTFANFACTRLWLRQNFMTTINVA